MAGVNWGGIANSGFDAFGNFQGGWETGSSSGTGYETFTNILNLAGQVAPTLGPAGAAFGVGLNQAATVNNTVSAIDKYNNGTIQPSDVLQHFSTLLPSPHSCTTINVAAVQAFNRRSMILVSQQVGRLCFSQPLVSPRRPITTATSLVSPQAPTLTRVRVKSSLPTKARTCYLPLKAGLLTLRVTS